MSQKANKLGTRMTEPRVPRFLLRVSLFAGIEASLAFDAHEEDPRVADASGASSRTPILPRASAQRRERR